MAATSMSVAETHLGQANPGGEVIPHWYAVYTCANHEKTVARQLEDREIEIFLPTYRSVRRWKDRQKELSVPLFPNYLFVSIEQRQHRTVLQVPGVVNIVSSGGRLLPLPAREIFTLRNSLCGPGSVVPHPYLRFGRRVRITSGPLAGLEGVLVRRKENLRVVLSIELIQRSVAIEVAESEITPVTR